MDPLSLITYIIPAGTAFFAALVEFVEALTIVLAVATVKGWRPALAGTFTGVTLLILLILFFGKTLSLIPIATLQLVIGTLLILFGMRWLRKAILRSIGIIKLHDEEEAFANNTSAMRGRGIDAAIAFATTFKATVLEGLEVVFIVLAVGADRPSMMSASAGALAALIAVVALGAVLRRPLAAIPENFLKFIVGVLLSAFGTFWIGEGLRFSWPGGDWSLLALIAAFAAVSNVAVFEGKRACRQIQNSVHS